MTNNDEMDPTQHSSRTLLANEYANVPGSIEVNYIDVSKDFVDESQFPTETVLATQSTIIILAVTGTILIVAFFAVYLRRNIKRFKKDGTASQYAQRFNAKYTGTMRDATYEDNMTTGSDGETTTSSMDSDLYATDEIDFEDEGETNSDRLFWKATAAIDYTVDIDQDDDFANDVGLQGEDDDSPVDLMDYII